MCFTTLLLYHKAKENASPFSYFLKKILCAMRKGKGLQIVNNLIFEKCSVNIYFVVKLCYIGGEGVFVKKSDFPEYGGYHER